jgi:diguanylate cyclase (GGDEF)-like protein
VLARRPVALFVLGCALLAAAVTVTTVLQLSDLRERAIADAERELQNTAVVLAAQTDRTFKAVEIVETDLIRRIQSLGVDSAEDFDRALSVYDTHLLLKDKLSSLPHIDTVALVNSRGRIISSSAGWPGPEVDISDRQYFMALKSDPLLTSLVSEPVRARSSGTWDIFMARKVTGHNGEFVGMILGGMQLQGFEQLYQTIALGSDGVIALLHRDGMLLARYPHSDPSIGRSFAGDSLFTTLLAHSARGINRQISPVDQTERLIAAASLTGYPVVVTVGRGVDAVLADWRAEAGYLIGLTVVLVVVIGGTGAVLIRRFREQSRRLDTALNNMTHGLDMYDRDMRLILCNSRYVQMYDIPAALTEPGTPLHRILQFSKYRDTPLDEAVADMAGTVTAARSFSRDLADGRTVTVSLRPVPDGGWVGVHEDVTERERARARIAHMARHDALTGLPNRVAFNEMLGTFLGRAKLENGRFAVLGVNLDRFKEVNDVFGHGAGDGVLGEVARRLEAAASGAFVARLGGDEFAVLSAQEPQPAATEALAERVQGALAQDILAEGQSLRIDVSVGVAIFPADGEDAASLLANADAALSRAKAEGRGSVRFFDPTMDQRLRDCRALQHDLRSAAERGEIVIHYQPQAQVDGSILGFEALVRWWHPVHGMIAPGAFIAVAEESGLIAPLGEWILREACREAASWPKPLGISVNLSPVQFRHGDLAATVQAILAETGLSPDRLELEITEGVLISDTSRALSVLRRLKDLGLRIAMDDFGTGYSSLSYLQQFPFDKIKIDRSFVSHVQMNPQSATIVRAVIRLGRGLNLPIIAEGVETQGELEFLTGEGCNEVQGFLFGRPAPIAQYAELVGRDAFPQSRAATAG